MKEWFILNTLTGKEQKVQRLIQSTCREFDEVRKVDLSEYIGEVLVPMGTETKVRNGVSRTVKKKLFPGYVFVEIELYFGNSWKKTDANLNRDLWNYFNSLDGVIGFLGAERNSRKELVHPPQPLPASEVEAFKAMIAPEKAKPTVVLSFEPGETVKIIDGAFAGSTGVIQSVNPNPTKPEESRVVVSVTIFGGETPVDLSYLQIERYNPAEEEAEESF